MDTERIKARYRAAEAKTDRVLTTIVRLLSRLIDSDVTLLVIVVAVVAGMAWWLL